MNIKYIGYTVLVVVLVAGGLLFSGIVPTDLAVFQTKPTPITLWSSDPNRLAEYTAREAEVERKCHVKLELVSQSPSTVFSVVNDNNSSNPGPDIIETQWQYLFQLAKEDPKHSKLLPLNQWVERSALAKKVLPAAMTYFRLGKQQYGLPHDVSTFFLLYNDQAWRRAGIDVAKIKTWDEFFSASLIACRDTNGDTKPDSYIGMGSTDVLLSLVLQSGLQILDDKGNPELNNPRLIALIKKWIEWNKSGAVLDMQNENPIDGLTSGKLIAAVLPDAFVYQGIPDNSGYTNKVGEMKWPSQLKAKAVPYLDKASARRGFPYGMGLFMGINANTKYADVCYQVMEELLYGSGAAKARRATSGLLVPIPAMWTEDVLQVAKIDFQGQDLTTLQTNGARLTPSIRLGDAFMAVAQAFGEGYDAILSGSITVEEALNVIQRKAMDYTLQMRNK